MRECPCKRKKDIRGQRCRRIRPGSVRLCRREYPGQFFCVRAVHGRGEVTVISGGVCMIWIASCASFRICVCDRNL
ncbi:hypothetical protein ADH70_018070 [Blautia pseudococcoides]|uniref:Uncharacterized protein n=1 Tax=Blautia pseudococcoides TaxID=1796616 RepID=A0A1C7IDK1_9FIRM|nr:hypothetical protein A4V09_19475 [Blautia pseudococcoides]ASU30535.1 hypothetical protein ADH70_018070 [Blautia pseudococcoides]